MAGNDANTLVRVGDDPATLADRLALSEGLEAFARSLSERPAP